MVVKMKAAFLCCILLLAGSTSASQCENKSISLSKSVDVPEWVLELICRLPNSIQEFFDKLPAIIEAVPDILENIKEIVEDFIKKIPELVEIFLDKLPVLIETFLDKLPVLIDIIPDIIKYTLDIIIAIIDKAPEAIPVILDKLPELVVAIPDIVKQIKEKIRECFEEFEFPDWFPELEKPEWWPDLPTLPEYNSPTPGSITSVVEHPSIVQIEIGAGPIWAQGCVGSILTSFHVLSAARCFTGKRYNPRYRRVRAGASSRYADGQIENVAYAIIHPDFNAKSYDGDIAVIRLTHNMVFSNTIQQAAIVAQGFGIPANTGVRTVGWGSTAQGKLFADRNLYQMDLITVDNESCAERWSKIPFITISDNMFCVADPLYGGRNGDLRDIGAPMIYQDIIVGIQSSSVPAGNQYFPLVATSVGSYTDWIIASAV